MITETIFLHDVRLIVHFDYSPGCVGTWEEPGEDPEISINKVEVISNGLGNIVDITPLLDFNAFAQEVETLLWERKKERNNRD